MPFNIGPLELVLVLVLALLILGPGKLPEVGSAVSRTLRDIRKAATAEDQPSPDSQEQPTPATDDRRS